MNLGRWNKRIVKNHVYYGMFLLLPFTVYTWFFVKPTLMAMVLSFYKWNGISAHKLFVGFQNYKTILLLDPQFWFAVKSTLTYAFGLMIAETLLALILALLIYHKSKMNHFFRTLFYMPGILSTTAVAFMWSAAMLDPNYGLIDTLFNSIGLNGLARVWLGEKPLILYSILAVQIYMSMGMSMIIFIAGLQDIPKDLYEASKLEGASTFQNIRYITLPLLKPVTSIVLILEMINGFRSFDLVFLLAGNNSQVDVLSTFIYKEDFMFNKMGIGNAAAVILLLIVLIITTVQRLLMREE